MRFVAVGWLLAVPWLAMAQVPAGALGPTEIEYLHVDPAGRGSLFVGNGELLPSGTYSVSTSFQYANNHLRSVGGATLLNNRFDLTLAGAVGLGNLFELDALVPVVLSQSSPRDDFQVASRGFGNPYLGVKVGLFDRSNPVAVDFSVAAGLPLGSEKALANGGFSLIPSVNLGRRFSRVQVGVDLSATLRTATTRLTPLTYDGRDAFGSQLALAVMASGLGKSARGEATVRLFAPIGGGTFGAEGLVGVRYPFHGVELFVEVGPGVGGAPINPSVRAYVGISYGTGGVPTAACVEGQSYDLVECPDLDFDHDGVPNRLDQCPSDPEDLDGFEDEDGCPDPDNDRDGVLDVDDACPLEPGPAFNLGCPVIDIHHQARLLELTTPVLSAG